MNSIVRTGSILLALVAGSGCLAKGTPSATGPGGAAAGSTASLDGDAFYAISTVVDGKEVALTFQVPEGASRGALTTSPSSAAVVLQPPRKDATQQWRPTAQDVAPGDVYTLYAAISDDDSRQTGVLELQNPDNRFEDSDSYREEHNRLTVGLYSNENVEYWIIKKLPSGAYRISSMLAAPDSLNEAGADAFPTRWNEARSLAAIKDSTGAISIRHEVTAETPAQSWTFTRVRP